MTPASTYHANLLTCPALASPEPPTRVQEHTQKGTRMSRSKRNASSHPPVQHEGGAARRPACRGVGELPAQQPQGGGQRQGSGPEGECAAWSGALPSCHRCGIVAGGPRPAGVLWWRAGKGMVKQQTGNRKFGLSAVQVRCELSPTTTVPVPRPCADLATTPQWYGIPPSHQCCPETPGTVQQPSNLPCSSSPPAPLRPALTPSCW